ncbi:MAG TPA: D-tyrosyl-tRNA(Tyr) deacylase [Flavobacteriaceae bacterium]|nr:D-tyrosyl-tRNA(Tyr) deacylase [Flavobacteriaceae bacterium]HBS13004.1 D-tyrosyl-tRNA(Tyr) deacylase [Flavobacteriaceae bacterium]
MKAIIQRVSKASVTVDDEIISSIDHGLLILLGIGNEDSFTDIEWLAKKILNLRIFNDSNNIMNTSVMDSDGAIIVVSQFTLMASTKKGNRPSYIKAAKPEIAIPLYEQFIAHLEKEFDKKVGTGIFGADMKIELLNDGPVTILLDSLNKE